MSLKAGDWAAWVGAVGAVAAAVGSLAAIIFFIYQNRKENKQREHDRDDRAKVVAVRLSVWLAEVADLIITKLEKCEELTLGGKVWNPALREVDLSNLLKMNVSGRIEDLMSDLHYLRHGSADVAQLDYFIKEYDAYIDKTLYRSQAEIFYTELERRLMNLKQLCANASRHLDPIIQDAVTQER